MNRLQAIVLVALVFCAKLLAADSRILPFISPVFGDHMVLQREKPNRIWGWTLPGATVRVEIAGKTSTSTAAADGRWQTEFTPPSVGGPYTLVVDGPQKVEFHDILVGDVWLCSGQSNMEFPLAHAHNGAAEVAAANFPGIRLFRTATQAAYSPAATLQGAWKVCAPDNISAKGGFSAVAYFFARKVHTETGIPIGLIQSAVGGSPAESWLSAEALHRLPEFRPALAEIARLKAKGGPEYGNYVNHWYDEYERGEKEKWSDEKFDDSSWKPTALKTGFADLGVPEFPAVCWFRREITLPDPLPDGTARIHLGVVEKMDTVYINGQFVGASSWVENPRSYPIRTDILRPGRNVVAIRVLKTKPDGGFTNPAKDLKIALGDGTSVALEGRWHGALSVDARPPHPLPIGYENYPSMPTVLFNGMIQPFTPLALTGVLWYQGESNQGRAEQYRILLPALIADWRKQFAQGEFPFYIVALPRFTARQEKPLAQAGGWTQIRGVQMEVGRTVPHAGSIVTVDTGDAKDIHPTDKQPVGERLALIALKNVYTRNVPCSGPTFSQLEQLPGALRIHFSNTEGGLVVKGGKLGEFAIAGKDLQWHWAEARIEGDTVIVSSPKVPHPIAASYAWQDNPLATLYNGASLPAEPFCTVK